MVFSRARSSKERPEVADPSGRFIRSDEYVAIRQSLLYYRGYDQHTGCQVTWNEVLFAHCLTHDEQSVVSSHAQRILHLRHDSLALLHQYWLSADASRIFFISEEIASRSIVDGFLRGGSFAPRAIARWFVTVLDVLHYLHSQTPPVIHHKIHLSSIFVRSTSRAVKVGLPQLVPPDMSPGRSHIVVSASTPPERLSGDVTPAADIWQFGLALLEAITKQTPYAECATPAELVDKFRRFQPPAALGLIENEMAADLIGACLRHPKLRPSARDLARHPFFKNNLAENEAPKRASSHGMVVIFPRTSTGLSATLPVMMDAQRIVAGHTGVRGSISGAVKTAPRPP
jgi:WNK lysine deficient protein kinase